MKPANSYNSRQPPSRANRLLAVCGTLLVVIFLWTVPTWGQDNPNPETATPPPPAADQRPKHSIIRGRVIGADDGKPVRRANVAVIVNITNYKDAIFTATDLHGEFTVKEVAAGTYYFMVTAPGLINPPIGTRDFVSVDGESNGEVTISLAHASAISGRVRYADKEPVVNKQMVLLRQDADGKAAALPLGPWATDDVGEFRISGLPPGTYIVGLAELTKSMNDPRTGLASVYYPSATELKDARAITVAESEEVRDIEITLLSDEQYSISGKVRRSGSSAFTNITVTLTRKGDAASVFAIGTVMNLTTFAGKPERGLGSFVGDFLASANDRQTTVDSEGSWSLGDLSPGIYRLRIKFPLGKLSHPNAVNDPNYLDSLDASGERFFGSKEIEVTIKDRDIGGLIVELTDGALISGTVHEDITVGEPTTVMVTGYFGENRSQSAGSALSRTNRAFKLQGVPAGSLLLDAFVVGSDERYVRSMTWSDVDLLREPLKVTDGAQIDAVQIDLGTDVAVLQGTVVGTSGSPAIGATVWLAPIDKSLWKRFSAFHSVRCDSNGKFEIRLPPGRYLALTWPIDANPLGSAFDFMTEHANQATTILLQPSETKQVELGFNLTPP
jgi:hypothetical protein